MNDLCIAKGITPQPVTETSTRPSVSVHTQWPASPFFSEALSCLAFGSCVPPSKGLLSPGFALVTLRKWPDLQFRWCKWSRIFSVWLAGFVVEALEDGAVHRQLWRDSVRPFVLEVRHHIGPVVRKLRDSQLFSVLAAGALPLGGVYMLLLVL